MAEQGAVRRQRAPGIQVCANCAGLFAVERRGSYKIISCNINKIVILLKARAPFGAPPQLKRRERATPRRRDPQQASPRAAIIRRQGIALGRPLAKHPSLSRKPRDSLPRPTCPGASAPAKKLSIG